MTEPIRDRRVHARSQHAQLVRYEKAGKWFVEWVDVSTTRRRHVVLDEAVAWALRNATEIRYGVPGGGRFDARVKRLR